MDRAVLFQEVFKALGVEHAYAQVFEVRRRSAGQSLLRPTRYRSEALLDLPAKDRQFASFELAAQNFVVQNIIENWHLSRLSFHRFLKVPKTR